MGTHEFGLTYKEESGIAKYLLVKPSDGSETWVLPKGHIESGESDGQTAIREVEEEAGVRTEHPQYIGEVSFDTPKEHVSGKGYLLKFIGPGEAMEARETRWFTPEELARIRLHSETRQLLEAAEALRSR